MKRTSACRGFSLVEVLMIMVIMSLVMTAVFSLFISTHKSTVVQNRVGDVQENLRLALRVMTRDLLNAGFMVIDDPITFPVGPPSPATANAADFTIRTRIVGGGFGRVVADGTGALTLGSAAMAGNFKAGSKVCFYEPLQTNALDATPSTVSAVAGVTVTTDYPNPVPAETIMVLVTNTASCTNPQTIRYRVNDGNLERIVNGDPQILARGVDTVNFAYGWTDATSPPQRVRRVDISLLGTAKGVAGTSAIPDKDREVQTSVTLRNVF